MNKGKGWLGLAGALGWGSILLAPGCRGFITEKTETTVTGRRSTRVEQTLQSLQTADASLEREFLRVRLVEEQPCVLVHEDEVQTTTTTRQEPIQRSTLLLSIAGTILGGAITLPMMVGYARCGSSELGDLCRGITLPPLLVGMGILIPSGGVLVSHIPMPDRVSVSPDVVSSRERAVCSREPRKSVAAELVFPSGGRFQGLADDAGEVAFPVSEGLAAELRASDGKLALWVDGLPLRNLDLSAHLGLLPLAPRTTPPALRRERRSPGSPGPELW
jgi:hypothetical protein